MADPADLADEQSEIYLADAMRRARLAHDAMLAQPNDWAPVCANCDAELASKNMRFCDSECRESFEYRRNIRRKQGLL
jgi:predicted nucleic acid-binding Zn ribbon protein